MRGKLICLEGIDGSGKETQLKLVLKFLKGRRVRVYKYPDVKSMLGRIIGDFLRKKVELTPLSQFFIYMLDIAKDQGEIERKLESGEIVVLSRYMYSTIAYQCSKGVPFEKGVEMIESMNFAKPDLVVLLDVLPEVAMERKSRQKEMDRHEEDAELLRKVRENYLTLYDMNFLSKKWVKVEAEVKPQEVFEIVKDFIAQLLKE
ncbi:MAG: Thymidylate kinase [Candidatus Fermentimicrarchaeum limneticum]|uniref:Probable thymidylate kinase n=1 Tax=Fermentimicrarchaeum limneticum TaxID=2795018 RepID=A0A7D5XLZ8_FERL1|nr:MAG: Thymidylate kinase [Candidatus Fermentimicrarchaeum limneticum]